ncbi:hypothetical protein [Mycobacteroides abscessus]|uniref:hypothetical protein n=1 Tax=Mycobacteroides abscessus TaxID=36809 RepID=UPI000926F608|nr:hypothetical protein [Mycobacteroides abscessus]SIL72755.1 Uncharacterised protein [Mycobacteroides abscessus subsp. abscessus]SKT45976.1 Uncharacterised protein [Mycobacteroides abscessus subsp. bolletii]
MTDYDDDGRNIMVAELRIIKFIDDEGALHMVDLSQGAGGAELEDHDRADLVEWAQSFGLAPKVMSVIASMTDGDDEDDV